MAAARAGASRPSWTRARREATKATAAMHRHMADSAALAGASEANDAYARFRRKLLRHSDSMTPAMRSKLLEQKRPTQKVTITRADLARFVSDCQTLGLEVVKHNRKGKADRRLLKLTSDAAALYWTMPNGKAASSKERFYLHKCLELRAGHDVDPDARNKLICGTETLRSRCRRSTQARLQLHLRGPHRGRLLRDRRGLQAVDALLQGPRPGPEEQGGPRGHAQGRAAHRVDAGRQERRL